MADGRPADPAAGRPAGAGRRPVIGFDDVEIARTPIPADHRPAADARHRRNLARQLLRLARDEDVEPALILPDRADRRESS